MKRRLFENFRAPLLPGIVALTAFSALGANTTYTFRNGTNSYTGSSDFAINTQYSQYNGGNGIQWKGGSELGCYNVTDANPENTLLVSHGDLDLSAVGGLTGIDTVDLGDTNGADKLTLNAADVLAVSGSGNLSVVGGPGDVVDASGGWTPAGTDGSGNNLYVQGGAQLTVDPEVTVNLLP